MKQRAFTLIESMVVVALLALLLALAGPSMRELLAVQRVKSINDELVTDLHFARSEAARLGSEIYTQFQSDPSMSCYVIYRPMVGPGGNTCSCTNAVGNACPGTAVEIKTVQIPVGVGVALAASSAIDHRMKFVASNGTSEPPDFRIDVNSNLRGALRTQVNAAGRTTVCTPDGSIKNMPAC
jgi:type IV fimbrial biogenesis protein FimT